MAGLVQPALVLTTSGIPLISYLGSGEYRDRYLGVKIPPTNLQDHHLEEARTFADRLADRPGALRNMAWSVPGEVRRA